jgi:Fe-S cluster assembly ATPase SufC
LPPDKYFYKKLVIIVLLVMQEGGKIVKTGDSSLAKQLDEGGYKAISTV